MEFKNEELRSIGAAWLVVNAEQLSIVIQRSPVTVKNQIYRHPEKLPPWVEGSYPRIWYMPVVEAWLAERSGKTSAGNSVSVQPMKKRGPGAPRKQGGIK